MPDGQQNDQTRKRKRTKQKVRIRYRERVRIKERPRGYHLKRFLKKNLRLVVLMTIFLVALVTLGIMLWNNATEEQREHLRFMREAILGWHDDWV